MFVIDTSGSMRGGPLESAKRALFTSLSNLDPKDTFNIIAFNREFTLFAPSMEPATEETILKATEWVETNFVPNGGTNILLALEQVSNNTSPFLLHCYGSHIEKINKLSNTYN